MVGIGSNDNLEDAHPFDNSKTADTDGDVHFVESVYNDSIARVVPFYND